MKLTYEQIKSVTHGAVNVEEKNEKIYFNRFKENQRTAYKDEGKILKTYSNAGINLEFETDSEYLHLKINVESASSRSYYAMDILEDEKIIGWLGNLSQISTEGEILWTKKDYTYGEHEGNYKLKEGKKVVRIEFPWSANAQIEKLELSDGAYIKPVKKKYKCIMFGDSITHGYDALHPSNSYAVKLTKLLDAELYNKAIGGDIFNPVLADMKDDIQPDFIITAYGTNDLTHSTYEEFNYNVNTFFKNLIKSYGNVKIYAVTPIWRKDNEMTWQMGPFENVVQGIADAVKDMDNVKVIEGWDLVPHDENLYADYNLHPNEEGFEYYTKNLYEQINN